MPKWLVYTLFTGLAAIFVLMPFHAFLSTWGGTAIGPLWAWKSWKELLLVLLVLATMFWLGLQPGVIKALWQKTFVKLLLGYLAVTVLLAILYWRGNGGEATSAGLAMNLRYLAVAALSYLLFCYGGVSRQWVRRGSWVLVGAGVVVAVLGIMQVLVLPGDFLGRFGYDKETTIAPASLIDNKPDFLRAFATLRGPNDFGAFLILPIVLVIARFRSLPRVVGVSVLAILCWALVLSSSRSAWIGLIVAVVGYAILRFGRKLSRRQIGVGLVSLVFATFLILYASINVPAIRMAVFHSSPGDPTLTEGSTDNHIAATLGGVARVAANPLGCGPGCAGPASYYGDNPQISENYFVQIAEETGVVGLGLFVTLLVTVALTLYRSMQLRTLSYSLLAAVAGYAAIGMLLHVWADDPLSITWWLLAGAVLGYNERNSWIKSKSSSHFKT